MPPFNKYLNSLNGPDGTYKGKYYMTALRAGAFHTGRFDEARARAAVQQKINQEKAVRAAEREMARFEREEEKRERALRKAQEAALHPEKELAKAVRRSKEAVRKLKLVRQEFQAVRGTPAEAGARLRVQKAQQRVALNALP